MAESDFVGVLKLRILRCGDYPGGPRSDHMYMHVITWKYKREEDVTTERHRKK